MGKEEGGSEFGGMVVMKSGWEGYNSWGKNDMLMGMRTGLGVRIEMGIRLGTAMKRGKMIIFDIIAVDK